MPRPPFKRSKLSHPTPSKRVVNASKVSLVEEIQQKLANKPIGRVLTDSDDSDKLITSKRTGRNRSGIPRKDIYASGGVGLGDVPGAHRSKKKQSQGSKRVDIKNSASEERTAAATQPGKVRGAAKPTVNERPQAIERRTPAIHSSRTVPGLRAVSRAPTRLQNTPAPEISILGTIKPRRRQPSILQLLGNNDSSNIDNENEDDFLPNDESTPLDHPATHATTCTPNSPLSNPSPSRKRKLTPPTILVPASQQRERSPPGRSQATDAVDEPCSEPELPPSRQSGKAPLRVTPKPDDPDIMAPPLSSSPLKSPAKPAIPSPVKKALGKSRKRPPAPSTSELRALMPTRRQRKGRLRTETVSEFDIPADTSGDDSEGGANRRVDPDDDPSFRAEKKGRKSNAATKKKAKPVRKTNNARIRGTENSTISPTKLVTPLKRPTAQKSAAKSSLSQQPGHGSATTKGKTTCSLHPRDISGDKENRPVDLSGDFSGWEGSPEDDKSVEQSIEKSAVSVTKEMKMVAKKFADVDEWEMEFEDVSLGGNSSPNRR